MSDTDIHSCGYYCDRHACIVAQRNELRDKLFEGQAVKTYSGGKPNYTQPIEKRWVGLTSEELEFYTEELGQGELGRGVLRAVVDFLKEKNLTTEKNIQISDKKEAESARAWVNLTDAEIADVFGDYMDSMDEAPEEDDNWGYERLLEAKIKEKND